MIDFSLYTLWLFYRMSFNKYVRAFPFSKTVLEFRLVFIPYFFSWMKTTDYTYASGRQDQFTILHINCLGSSTGRVFYVQTAGNKFVPHSGYDFFWNPTMMWLWSVLLYCFARASISWCVSSLRIWGPINISCRYVTEIIHNLTYYLMVMLNTRPCQACWIIYLSLFLKSLYHIQNVSMKYAILSLITKTLKSEILFSPTYFRRESNDSSWIKKHHKFLSITSWNITVVQ